MTELSGASASFDAGVPINTTSSLPPSPALQQRGVNVPLEVLDEYQSPGGAHYFLCHGPGQLYFVIHPSGSSNGVDQIYSAPEPEHGAAEFANALLEQFRSVPAEQFERQFLKLSGAQSFESGHPAPNAEAERRIIERGEYLARLIPADLELMRPNGSLIRAYRFRADDPDTPNRFVIALLASKSPESEMLTLPIIGSERWTDLSFLSELLKNLRYADGLQIPDTFRRLQALSELRSNTKTIEHPLVFRGEDPTSHLLHDLVESARRELFTNGESEILQVRRREDLALFEAAQRILERRDVVEITFTQPADNGHSFEHLYLSLDDEGRGKVLLCIGPNKPIRRDLSKTPELPFVSVGDAMYEVDLNMSSDERRDWTMDLLSKFIQSRHNFPGAITEFLNGSVTGTDGYPVSTLQGTNNIDEDHLNPQTSLARFTSEILGIFRNRGAKVSILEQDMDALVIEASNEQAIQRREDFIEGDFDRIQMTVRSNGVHEIFVLPRYSSTEPVQGVGFLLAQEYQFLPSQFRDRLMDPLASFFTQENGRLESFTDNSGNVAHNIGALKTIAYLKRRLSTNPTGDAGKPYVCMVVPSTAERCAQHSSKIAQIQSARGDVLSRVLGETA